MSDQAELPQFKYDFVTIQIQLVDVLREIRDNGLS